MVIRCIDALVVNHLNLKLSLKVNVSGARDHSNFKNNLDVKPDMNARWFNV